MNSIPSRKDISPTQGKDLDERRALRNLHGKDYKKAAEILWEDFVNNIEDYFWIGNRAFLYYLRSINIFIKEYLLEQNLHINCPIEVYVISSALEKVFRHRTSFPESTMYYISSEDLRKNPDIVSIKNIIIRQLEWVVMNYDNLASNDVFIRNVTTKNELNTLLRQYQTML
ncbi:MAG: hypothetical protein UHK44_08460 [Bacteroidaceae bacterium]|nr:hypothetical protein [Bacteroidaceae bacterium]